MATQNYRSRSDDTVGTNSGTTRPVHPARPELTVKPGAENKTPAPTTTVGLALGKDTIWGQSNGAPGDNPGKNRYGGASSIPPGTKAAPATVNPQAPTDVVMDNIIRGGARGAEQGDSWQTRDLNDAGDRNRKASPVHPAMTGARPGGTVPSKTGSTK